MSAHGQPPAIDDLIALMARLHGPDGCPWCLAQTHQSLAEELLKEAYEVVDAVARGDAEALPTELGDMLLNLLAHAQLGIAAGAFTFSEIIVNVNEKLIRRHPHIFGDLQASTPEEALGHWESMKASERAGDGSALEGIPRSLPALLRAEEMQQRAARVGFDWPDLGGVMAKIHEEVDELGSATPGASQVEEFGDLLFALVNLARRLGFSPERALHDANDKFARRFAAVEAACRERGIRPQDLSLEELDALWNLAKAGGLG